MNGNSSIRWTGSLTAPVDGSYQLSVVATGSSTLYLDGTPIIQTAPSTTPQETTVERRPDGRKRARAARRERERRAQRDGQRAGVQARWVPPEGVVAPQALAAADLARNAQAAVVVVRDYSSEGGDRPSLNLPNGQEEVIRQVAAANPHTVVVLTSGAGVETSNWEAGVPAILQAWYGGQEQGNAIANILFGDVNPSGKLPITVPTDEASTPVSSPEQFPGVGLDQQFTEGSSSDTAATRSRHHPAVRLRPWPVVHELRLLEAQDLDGQGQERHRQAAEGARDRAQHRRGRRSGDRAGLRRPPPDPRGADGRQGARRLGAGGSAAG